MASDIAYSRPLPPPPPVSTPKEIDPEETIILRQVESARRRIATVELTWRVLVLVAGTIVFAIIAAVFDQWVFPKGMPNAVRWSLWAVFIAASLAWMIVSVGPYLIRRIHPVFAAYVVEQAVPSLKHGLISFLTLRGAKDQFETDPIRKNVFRGLETTTADTVAKVPVEAVVDRSQIIRAGYVLIVLVALFCLYIVFSPKDPFRSFARALFPWSHLSPPTRVKIDDVRPGTKGIIEGERVVVSANVRGLRNGEDVKVLYSTADGQAVNQLIPMSRDRENSDLFSCELSQSFQQETVYRVLAGDASTEEFRLNVVIPLRLHIRRIEYLFPRYTGLAPRVTEDLGDIRAVEGTQIKMTVESDTPLSSAEMVMEKAQTTSIPMVVKNQEAFARTTLRLSKPEGRERELGTYFIRGESADGRPSVDPVKYTIEIIPDQPPQGTWLEPKQEQVDVPVDGTFALRFRAEDPDFGLRQVALEIEAGGSKLVQQSLLDKSPGESHSGEFLGEFLLLPKSLNLAAGDVAICRVALADNREPTPNRSELPIRRIRIVEHDRPATSDNRQPQPSSQQAQDQRTQTEPKTQDRQTPPPESGSQSDAQQNEQPKSENASPDTPPKGEKSSSDPSARTSEQNAADQSRESQGAQSEPAPSPAATENHNGEGQSQKNAGAENGNEQAADSTSGQSKPEPSDHRTSSQPGEKQAGAQSQEDSSQGGDPSQRTQTPSDRNDQGIHQSDSQPTPASQQPGRENSGEGQQTVKEQQSGEREGGPQQSGDQRTTTAETQNGDEPRQGMSATQQQGDQQGREPSGQNKTYAGDSRDQRGGAGKQQQSGSSDGEKGTSGTASATRTQQEPNQVSSGGSTSSGSNQATANNSSPAPENANHSGSRPGAGATTDNTGTGQRASQEGSKPSEKVDGITNPGEAVERILSYLEKKGVDPSELSQGTKATGKEAPSGEQTGKKPSQEQNPEARPSGGLTEHTSDPQKTPDQGTEARPGASSDTAMGPQSSAQNQQGAGNQARPEKAPPMGTTPASGGPSDRHSRTQDSGEPPAAAQPQAASRQTNPQSPQGTAGDQAGMGGRGGGQQTPQPGEGTPGSQTPTDSREGTPVASPGGQETGQPTGASETSTPSGADNQDAGMSPQGTKTSQNAGASGQTGPSRPGSPSRTESGGTSQGGMPGGTRGPGSGSPVVDTPVDDPNLEYARRQTDLVLRYLENELAKQDPDKELLGQLGWSPQEAAEFIRRWKELKQAAEEPSPNGKIVRKQLNEILKSLGLKPKTSTIQGSQQHQDELRGMDAGRDVPPPPQWSEYFQAYLRSLGAAP